jgi:hypothetical protein
MGLGLREADGRAEVAELYLCGMEIEGFARRD